MPMRAEWGRRHPPEACLTLLSHHPVTASHVQRQKKHEHQQQHVEGLSVRRAHRHHRQCGVTQPCHDNACSGGSVGLRLKKSHQPNGKEQQRHRQCPDQVAPMAEGGQEEKYPPHSSPCPPALPERQLRLGRGTRRILGGTQLVWSRSSAFPADHVGVMKFFSTLGTRPVCHAEDCPRPARLRTKKPRSLLRGLRENSFR